MKAKENIAIIIAAQEGVERKYLDWVQYGLEEESIPYERMDAQEEDPKALADLAQKISKLGIGIGINRQGFSCLSSTNFKEGDVLFLEQRQEEKQFRDLGVNGARLLKGSPFKLEGGFN